MTDVRVELDEDNWARIGESQWKGTLKWHDGASLGFMFAHEEHGLHGFALHYAPGDCDLLVKPHWWEREQHHEINREVIVERDPPESQE